MNKEKNVFKIQDAKPLQRFTRESWKFHTFIFVKKEGLSYHYRSELTGFTYETTNKDLKIKILR